MGKRWRSKARAGCRLSASADLNLKSSTDSNQERPSYRGEPELDPQPGEHRVQLLQPACLAPAPVEQAVRLRVSQH
eukprot:2611589-Rhodomonas_salina.2